MRRQFVRFFQFTAIVIVYVLLGRLGKSLAFTDAIFSAFWPPTGFAIGISVLFGVRVLPAICLGATLTLMHVTGSWRMAAAVSLGDTLEALVAGLLVSRFVSSRNPLSRARDLFVFLGLAAVVSPMVSASLGTFFRAENLYGGLSSVYVWFVWWLENMTGVLVVAPLVIAWGLDFPPRWNKKKFYEGTLLFGLLILVAEIVFGGWFPSPVKDYPLEYLCIPILVWAAFRFGSKGAAGSIAVLSFVSIYGTRRGFGPFYRSSTQESLHLLQMYIGTNGILMLTLAAIVSERRQAEKQLARSNAELERFAYLASHDLQEPLRTVSSFCRLLERRYKSKLDADADEYIQLIVDAALRMHGMINSLLQYSRLGKRLQFSQVDTSAIVGQALANLEALVQESGARVTHGPLPTLSSDPALLVLLFQNIIGNAIKFRADLPPEIMIFSKVEHDEWLFSVADNGIGIDPQYCEKVFKLFQRAVSDPRYPGAGVGLAICKKIVEEHGGRIWMDSSPGAGTRIFFTLPTSSRVINREALDIAG